MTDEQKSQLEALKKQFMQKCFRICVTYSVLMLASAVVLVLVNALYVQNQEFGFFSSFGSTLIILTGMRGTLEEAHAEYQDKVKSLNQ